MNMIRERVGFRENLQDILEFSGGRRMLTVAEVKQWSWNIYRVKNCASVEEMRWYLG